MVAVNYDWDEFEDNVVEEYDDNGNTLATYTHEAGLHGDLISQHRDGQTSYYHYDGQGSTRQLTDENQTITDTYTYSAFGETVASTGTTVNPYRYIGEKGYQYNEETKDYYVRARTYEPTIARWTSVDPLGIMIDRADLYLYVANNPTLYWDSNGLKKVKRKKVKKEIIEMKVKCCCNFERICKQNCYGWIFGYELYSIIREDVPVDCTLRINTKTKSVSVNPWTACAAEEEGPTLYCQAEDTTLATAGSCGLPPPTFMTRPCRNLLFRWLSKGKSDGKNFLVCLGWCTGCMKLVPRVCMEQICAPVKPT